MNLSFFIVTVLYLSLILFVHYKIKGQDSPKIIKKIESEQTLDTIISLDDIDKDIENETIQDLKKFLSTPDLETKENFAPIIENLNLNEYFSDGEENFIEIENMEDKNVANDSQTEKFQAFDNIQAFNDNRGYQNFATV